MLPEQRFWKKVERRTIDECWPWLGAKDRKGYGQFMVMYKHIGAHRFSWQLANGPISDGLQVMHSCDSPSCVNPKHLSVGTARDNIQDMIAKGRGAMQKKTHCPKGHPYDETNTRRKPSGSRDCRTCDNDRRRKGNAPADRTHCPHGHEYTPENTYVHGGHRECRTCVLERVRRARANRLAAEVINVGSQQR